MYKCRTERTEGEGPGFMDISTSIKHPKNTCNLKQKLEFIKLLVWTKTAHSGLSNQILKKVLRHAFQLNIIDILFIFFL